MGATYRWHEKSLVLNGKMDGDTIFVFSHSTETTYEKKIKTEGTKNKIFKPQRLQGI
jgi:hypothetical protein